MVKATLAGIGRRGRVGISGESLRKWITQEQLDVVSVMTRCRQRAGAAASAAPDLVDLDFTATAPDQLWIAHFTRVANWQGVAYIAVVPYSPPGPGLARPL